MIIFLYFLFLFIILLSFLVVFSNNTIISMLSLIFCFVLTGLCFLLLGSEFLAFVLIIVYGSAISILFLFVIMLLNLRIVEIYHLNFYYIPFCIFLSIPLVAIIIILISNNNYFFYYNNLILNLDYDNVTYVWINYSNLFKYNSNLHNFGIVLYNHYYLFVILSGIILLIAMLGSILLVLDNKTNKDNFDFNNTKNKCLIKNYSIKI